MTTKESIKEAKKYRLKKTHTKRLTVSEKDKLTAKGYNVEDYVTPFGSHRFATTRLLRKNTKPSFSLTRN